jgi:hypothetical protein
MSSKLQLSLTDHRLGDLLAPPPEAARKARRSEEAAALRAKAPITKNQAPEKFQVPNSKFQVQKKLQVFKSKRFNTECTEEHRVKGHQQEQFPEPWMAEAVSVISHPVGLENGRANSSSFLLFLKQQGFAGGKSTPE